MRSGSGKGVEDMYVNLHAYTSRADKVPYKPCEKFEQQISKLLNNYASHTYSTYSMIIHNSIHKISLKERVYIRTSMLSTSPDPKFPVSPVN